MVDWLMLQPFGSDEHPESPVYHPETDARGGLGGSMGITSLCYVLISFEASRGPGASVEPSLCGVGPWRQI